MLEMNEFEIDELLSETLIGRLCMASAQGRPYAIPIPFCWIDGTIYVRLPLSGRKGAVLGENDQVCFEIDQFTQSLDEYASVIVEGRLVEVTSLEEKGRVKVANDEKYNRLRRGYRPGHQRASDLASLPMRKIVVTTVSGRKKETAARPILAAEGI